MYLIHHTATVDVFDTSYVLDSFPDLLPGIDTQSPAQSQGLREARVRLEQRSGLKQELVMCNFDWHRLKKVSRHDARE